jgi:hypothetical protein
MPGDNHLIADGDTYASPGYPSNLPPSQGTPGEPFGLDPSDVFSGSDDNNDGYHELIEIPDPHYPDPVSTERYFDNAGVKVIINESGATTTATIYDNTTAASVSGGSAPNSNGVITGGSVVLGHSLGTITYSGGSPSKAVASGISTSGSNLFNSVAGALTFGQTIQDDRQGATMGVTELNIGTLDSNLASNGVTFNQIIYIADIGSAATTTANNSAQPTLDRGIELVNGATLPSGGLTIASQNPVYIQGDFNTGSNPPSNAAGTTDGSSASPLGTNSSGGTYTWQPASIAADAINVLSNAWLLNSESTESLAARVATNTTINAAIMSGNVPTTSTDYSGGAENFPRFLEDWSAATFTYYGSMVELYASEQATAPWGSSNVYNPPTRNWHYDNNFQLHPPPGSIMVVDYVKGQWYQY